MEVKTTKTEAVKEAIDGCCKFLSDFLPLANVQAKDFITEQLWESCLSLEVQKELLQCEELHLKAMPGLVITQSQEFITGNHSEMCELCLHRNSNRRDKTSSNGADKPGTAVKCESGKRCNVSSRATDSGTEHLFCHVSGNEQPLFLQHVERFMHSAAQHSLYGEVGRKVVTSLFCLTENLRIEKKNMDLMSQKKSHEVQVLADICARLAQHYRCKVVVDVGSGKGYLATHLASHHDLLTLAIDSSQSNTIGAVSRAKMLNKKHAGKTDKNAEHSAPVKNQEPCNSDLSELTNRSEDSVEEQGGNEIISKPKLKIVHDPDDVSSSVDKCTCTRDCYSSTMKNLDICDETSIEGINPAEVPSHQHSDNPAEVPSNQHSDTPAEVPSHQHSETHCIQSSLNFTTSRKVKETDKITNFVSENPEFYRNFIPVTHFISPETDVQTLVNLHLPAGDERLPEWRNLLLTGLHTCGDLASSVLTLFTSTPNIQAICTVGCCYNLLTEQYPEAGTVAGLGDSTSSESATSRSAHGFPLSAHLQKSRYNLGKAARNLAAQSLHRIARDGKLQGKMFFRRALLEKILTDQFGTTVATNLTKFRKLQQKSTSPYDYVCKAFHKLNLPTEKLTSVLVQDYVDRYKDQEFKMAALFQLRTLLAPCIETLILLDRVCFLLEQEDVDNVNLVQLFDPVISPRCYCLIATKGPPVSVEGRQADHHTKKSQY